MIIEELNKMVAERLAAAKVGKVILGLSGGSDSVALLLMLLASETDVKCVHCNFGLRGEESDEDERFVRDLCRRLGVELDCVSFDVEDYCRKLNVSVEMACRELRYEYFRLILRKERYDRIAVAHHQDDNIETVLLNLFRGTGIAGLRGMLPDTGEVIRPLLDIPRRDIMTYLGEAGETFRVDSSNNENHYRRNFIRNELLPLIETRWPGVRKAISRTAENMAIEEECLVALEKEFKSNQVDPDLIPNRDYSADVIGRRELRCFLKGHGMAEIMIAEMMSHARKGRIRPGSKWQCGEGMVEVSAEYIEWMDKGEDTDKRILPDDWEIIPHFNSAQMMKQIKKSTCNTLYTSLSPDQIGIRSPREGDRIYPLGMKGSKLVSDVIAESKLRPSEKHRVCVVYERSTDKIIWVSGIKRSKYGLASEEIPIIWEISAKRKGR